MSKKVIKFKVGDVIKFNQDPYAFENKFDWRKDTATVTGRVDDGDLFTWETNVHPNQEFYALDGWVEKIVK